MQNEDDVWSDLLKSVSKHRSYDARFYKPVCLYAAALLINEEALDPYDLQLEVIQRRFSDLISPHFPERAHMGWRPFWHLSNDGAWTFTKAGSKIEPSNFGVARKPDSIGQLLSRFDKAAIPEPMIKIWTNPNHRSDLQRRLVAILASDADDDCRLIAAHLPDTSSAFLKPTRLEKECGQSFEADPQKRKAIEDRAMTLATEWLTERGWEVRNVSGSRSYDLHCSKGSDLLCVEVKGTRSDGDEIILTVAERDLAERDPTAMALFIVSSIAIVSSEMGFIAKDGILKVVHPWSPDMHDLRPIAYKCVLKQTDPVLEI